MRWFWVITGAIALIGLAPQPASASPLCESETIRVAFQFPKIWKQAGNPVVLCAIGDVRSDDLAGGYDLRTNTIALRDGLPAYNRPIAHELGHAWLFHRKDPNRLKKYARIRGLPNAYASETVEDYAETFALALGEWAEIDTPAPYGFKTVAGLPTPEQIRCLRAKGLLPRT